MGMVPILVMWPKCGEQTFISTTDWGSIWNLALIALVVSKMKSYDECYMDEDVS